MSPFEIIGWGAVLIIALNVAFWTLFIGSAIVAGLIDKVRAKIRRRRRAKQGRTSLRAFDRIVARS